MQTRMSEPAAERDKRQNYELQGALADPLPATQVTFRMHLPPAVGGIVRIEFLVDTRTLVFEELPGQVQHANLDFMILASSPEGKLAAIRANTADARLH